MANIWCDPDGSNTSPYDTKAKARTSLNAAFGVAGDGDTIIMSNRLDHVVNGNCVIQSAVRSLFVVNETRDSDFTKVSFASWGAGNIINLNNATAAAATEQYTLTIIGITIDPAVVTGGAGGPIATPGVSGANSKGLTLNLIGVRFKDIESSGLTVAGGSLRINASDTTTAEEMVNVNLANCTWDGCVGGNPDTSDNATVAYFNNANVVAINCKQLNCGDLATEKSGHWLIQSVAADSAGVERTALIQKHYAENCIAGGSLGGDGGAIYFYAHDETTRTLYTNKMTATVEDSTFKQCGARKGGGFWFGLHADGEVNRCKFIENYALDFGGGAIGKGANTDTTADIGMAVEYCLFVRNEQRAVSGGATSGGGGAIRCDKSKFITVKNSTFVDNTAEGDEGGQSIWVRDHSGTVSATKSSLLNCVFYGSTGEPEVTTEANNGFSTIEYCAGVLGSSDFVDSGATISDIDTSTSADFHNYAADQFPLSATSLLRGAGESGSVSGDVDLINQPQPTVPNLGAYADVVRPTLYDTLPNRDDDVGVRFADWYASDYIRGADSWAVLNKPTNTQDDAMTSLVNGAPTEDQYLLTIIVATGPTGLTTKFGFIWRTGNPTGSIVGSGTSNSIIQRSIIGVRR